MSFVKGIVIAGTHSGVGKTTVASGLMALLSRRGYKVQPFKVGPDYIDPSYHKSACGLPSRNLDSWLLEEDVVLQFFCRAMRGKDLAVVEGVMGLYDGYRGEGEEGSTAQVAKLLGLPVILVVDAAAAARSVGAVVLGFKNFDAGLNLAGVILNGIASEKHLDFIKPSLEQVGVPLLGYLPRRPELALPERHLGLIPAVEGKVATDFYDRLSEQVERTVKWKCLLDLAVAAGLPNKDVSPLFPETVIGKRVAIAVALDQAFSFYYPDAIELLEAWGAEVLPFSPLRDRQLPGGVGGVYIGGGFPELYAEELSGNFAMLHSLRESSLKGLPIYAECGGLMYLGQTLEDFQGKRYTMAGVIPCRSLMQGTRLTLGYRNIRALDDNPLMSAGEVVRGHEFHLSALKEEPASFAAYDVLDQPGRREGFRINNTLASYVHLHFGSKRSLAPTFVDFCARWKAANS